MNSHSTDKGLMIGLVLTVLAVAVVTGEPKILDAFYIALGSAITAIASRVQKDT